MFVEVKEQKTNFNLDIKEKDTKADIPLNPSQSNEKVRKAVGFFKLICSLADKADTTIIVMAVLGSVLGGASMPLISLLLGKVLNNFDGNIANADVPSLVSGLITAFLLVGIAIFIGSYLMVFFWTMAGRRLINKINEDYFRMIMKQDQAWFDQSNMFEFATKVQIQIKTIENGVKIIIILDWKQSWSSSNVSFSIYCFIFGRIHYILAIIASSHFDVTSSWTRRILYGKGYGTRISKF